MQVISGYPSVDTVAVKAWTTATRPSSNNTSNYLLGFNTDNNALEVVEPSLTPSSPSGIINIARAIALFIYPVGSFFETVLPPSGDNGFDPNSAWGGTWVLEESGRVLVSANATNGFSLGQTGGAKEVTLDINKIPAHDHPHRHPHKHGRGDINITGFFGAPTQQTQSVSGAFSSDTHETFICGMSEATTNGSRINFSAAGGWSGFSSQDLEVNAQNENDPGVGPSDLSSTEHNTQGGGQAHENMPPYLVITRWRRTA